MRRFLGGFAALLLATAGPVLAQSSAGGGSGGSGGGGGPATQSGAWNVGITGTLPAFAATPTFNVGTIAGIATETGVQQVRTALGSPFQAGGSVGNTAFGISGTLPAFAATPTFNLGTLNGAATAANQASEISALGAPADAAWAGSGNSSIVAALKAAYPRALQFYETAGFGVASATSYTGITRDAGAVIPWARFNAVVNATAAGTLIVQGSTDNFTSLVTVGQATVAAGVPGLVTVPILFRYHRAVFTNTAGATNTIALDTSYTAN
jgi:hypothetical protein